MKRILLLFTLFCTSFGMNALQAQCPSLFEDGWESGTWMPTWSAAGGTYTRTVTTASPAVGTYCFSQSGTSSHYMGTTTTFGPASPPNLSIWVKSSAVSGNNSGYVVIGDANTTSNQGIIFFYFQSGGLGRLYAGASSQHQFNATDNTWYHLEFRNIDWTLKTFDYYIDGVLTVTGFPFRSGSSTNVDRIYLYNFSGTATAFYDDFTVGGTSLNLSPTPSDVLCDGDSTGTASIAANGGVAPYNYVWSNSATTQSISNLLPGTYQVTVTDSIGCSGVDSATVGAPPALASATSPSDALCNGDSTGAIDLTPSGGVGGYTYLWSNSSTMEDPSGLPSGTYSVVITDSNGCTHSDSATIGQPSVLALNAVLSNVSCNGALDGAIDLTPSGGTPGYAYTWNTSATSQDLSGLGGGTFTVFVADSNGCSTGAIYNIVEPAAINLSLQPTDVTCFGANDGVAVLTVNGGTPGYTYAWSNSTTAANASNLGPGTYSVVVTDSSGCTSSDTVTISEPAQITATGITVNDNGFNSGSVDVTIGGGSPGYTFSWTGPGGFTASTEDISGLAAGTYVLTVTDNNGCVVTQTFVVNLIIAVDPALNGPQISVAPNPTSGLVRVSVTLAEMNEVKFTLTDLRGRVIYEAAMPASGLQLERDFDLGNLAAGVYMMKVTAGEAVSWSRVVKN
jgi:hypothetical protein